MPLYEYRCECGESWHNLASYEDVIAICKACKKVAARVAFYRNQEIRTDDAYIPESEGEYKLESDKRALKGRGWDYDRALEHIRAHVVETDKGKVVKGL